MGGVTAPPVYISAVPAISAGNGASVNLRASDGVGGGNKAGGPISLYGGAGSGSSTGGPIYIQAGDSLSGTQGTLEFTTGEGTDNSAPHIIFKDQSGSPLGVSFWDSGMTDLMHLSTLTGDLFVKSTVTASGFSGDGSQLTGIKAQNIGGSLTGMNGTLGVGQFMFGYPATNVIISSITIVVMVAGMGGSSGTVWSCCYAGNCVSVTSPQGAAVGSKFSAHGNIAVPTDGQMDLEITSSGEVTTPTAGVSCGYK